LKCCDHEKMRKPADIYGRQMFLSDGIRNRLEG
jgi:hypothetical protein